MACTCDARLEHVMTPSRDLRLHNDVFTTSVNKGDFERIRPDDHRESGGVCAVRQPMRSGLPVVGVASVAIAVDTSLALS